MRMRRPVRPTARRPTSAPRLHPSPAAPPQGLVDMEAAWGINRGRDNAIIAIIDEGIDMDHPDLVRNQFTQMGADEPLGHAVEHLHVAAVLF